MGILIDLTGQRFGKLQVICQGETDGKTKLLRWDCICDCGTQCTVYGVHLRKGVTKSCGCYRKSLKALPNEIVGARTLLRRYKFDAKRRGLGWELSEGEFSKLISNTCEYCGEAPSQSTLGSRYDNSPFYYNGVDRVDNTKGYISDNCVSCCGVCNAMKSGMSYGEFKTHITQIYEHLHAMKYMKVGA
jgi:hypothetical protein